MTTSLYMVNLNSLLFSNVAVPWDSVNTRELSAEHQIFSRAPLWRPEFCVFWSFSSPGIDPVQSVASCWFNHDFLPTSYHVNCLLGFTFHCLAVSIQPLLYHGSPSLILPRPQPAIYQWAYEIPHAVTVQHDPCHPVWYVSWISLTIVNLMNYLSVGVVLLFTAICLAMAGHFQEVLATSDLSSSFLTFWSWAVKYLLS